MIGQRIELLINALGLNKNSFSKAIGLSNNVTIGRIVNQDREPSFEIIQKIIQTFGSINARWLITGEGDMFNNYPSNIINEPVAEYNKIDFKEKYYNTLEELAECRKQLIELQGNFPASGPIGVTKPIAKTGS